LIRHHPVCPPFMKKELKPLNAVVPCPVVLLSVAGEPKPNITTLSWVANVCSEPPTVVVGVRPARHSHDMMVQTGDFVVNIPSTELIQAVVFCGSKSGKTHDKFAECGLTAVPATKVSSPIIKECPINIECKTKQVLSIGSHDLFIAEVLAVHIDDSVLDAKGRIDLSKMPLFTYLPLLGEYWKLGKKIQ